MTEKYQTSGNTIWVARIIDYTDRFLPGGTIVSTVATVGLIPILLTSIFFSLTYNNLKSDFIISQILVMLVAVLGAFLIWYYDRRLFPEFLEQSSSIVANESKLSDIVIKYKAFFSRRFWLTSMPWTVLLLSAVLSNIEFFQGLGIESYVNFSLFVYLLLLTWFGIITGIGLHRVVTTIRCIREIGDLELEIDPLHPDQLGGLSNIGMFAIRTTMMNSIGALALPLAFTLATPAGYESLIYSVVAIYICFILFSFLYPTIYINKRAEDIREEELEKRRKLIHKIRDEPEKDINSDDTRELSVENQLQIQIIKDEFREYQNVSLYPFTLSILTRLVSSVLLPIMFILLDTYVISI